MATSENTTITLNNGVCLPLIGLGVFKMDSAQTQKAVEWALGQGYRLIDTAAVYGNEEAVGRAIAQSSISRQELFITTKVWNTNQGYTAAKQACDKSLQRLGLDYVDCYLIHWPVPGSRLDTWRALEELYAEGKCRSIGVSNYTIHHLDELLSASQIVPVLNQVEFSPFLYQKELLEYCHAHGIQLQAYAPLTRGTRLNDRCIVEIAQKYNRTCAQVLLRWALQHKVAVIPKSTHSERIRENADIFSFELSTQDMLTLDACNEAYRTIPWNPEKEEWA